MLSAAPPRPESKFMGGARVCRSPLLLDGSGASPVSRSARRKERSRRSPASSFLRAALSSSLKRTISSASSSSR